MAVAWCPLRRPELNCGRGTRYRSTPRVRGSTAVDWASARAPCWFDPRHKRQRLLRDNCYSDLPDPQKGNKHQTMFLISASQGSRRSRWHSFRELNSAGSPMQSDRKSTRLNSSHQIISYAVFCLKKKINQFDELTEIQ